MKWNFRRAVYGEKRRNPSLDFTFRDRDEDIATPLIRETVQNSLDAHDESLSDPVELVFRRVRLNEFTQSWMGELTEHLVVERSGLDSDDVRLALDTPNVDVLLIEDFNTTGLLGPHTGETPAESADKSKFGYFYFAHAEGESGKGADSRGSWGLGKHVLPQASRLNLFFAWTVRARIEEQQPSELFFGQCTLKYHTLNDVEYAPDGFFGSEYELNGEKIYVPSTEADYIDKFGESVGFYRDGEPGLSVAIPYLKKGYSTKELLKALIRNYYYSFKFSALVATVVDDITDDHYVVNAESIDELAEQYIGADLEFAAFRRVVLARLGEEDVHSMPKVTFGYNEYAVDLSSLIDDDPRREAVAALDAGKVVHTQIEFEVELKNPRSSGRGAVEVYLYRAAGLGSTAPVYYRDGIHLSDQRANRPPRDVFMALFVDSSRTNHLGALLRESENPAHTRWESTSERAKARYRYAGPIIARVRKLPVELVHALNTGREEVNRLVFSEFFPKPRMTGHLGVGSQLAMPNVPKTPSSPKTNARSEDALVPIIAQRKKSYQLQQVAGGGFSIRGEELEKSRYPLNIKVTVAYDTTSGDPFAGYSRFDFDFSEETPSISLTGDVRIVSAVQNTLDLRVESHDFDVKIQGFDENRDLKLKARAISVEEGE